VEICETCGCAGRHELGQCLANLKSQLVEARKAAEETSEKLQRIDDWCRAYPLDVFPKPDMKRVRKLLGDSLLTQLSAHNMRHVIEGLLKIINAPQGKESHD
jgi:hypothetical protein